MQMSADRHSGRRSIRDTRSIMGKNNDLARLKAAVREKNFGCLEKMLDSWTCCNYRDSLCEESLLHIAHHAGTEMVDFLLRHGIDPNEQDEVGDTVMNYAAAENKVDEIRLLLAARTLFRSPVCGMLRRRRGFCSRPGAGWLGSKRIGRATVC